MRLLILLLACCCRIAADEAAVASTADGGQCATREGVRLLSLVGDDAAMGRQAGELLAEQTRVMLATMALHPALAGLRRAEGLAALRAAVPERQRAELAAWAGAAKVAGEELLLANLAVDVLCTAVVHLPDPASGQPLRVARNMDFAPAGKLGELTVVIVRRPTGRRASLSVGWPGHAGIVSGMNDAGLGACLLLNHDAGQNPDGEPLGFTLRAVLEECSTLAQAIDHLAAHPVASSNYVLLADPAGAAVVWRDRAGQHRVDPREHWLFCTNARIDAQAGTPDDARGRHVRMLAGKRADPDLEWMRGVLTASYLHGINAQAMILEPATRTLHLATASGVRAAALSPWHALAGARLMAGDALDQVPIATTPALPRPWPHYTAAH
jgi:hypothetical protein